MDTHGTLHAPVGSIISLTANCAGYAVLCLCKDQLGSDSTVMGSRDGRCFETLFELTSESHGMAADREGCIWVAQGNKALQYNTSGAITGNHFSLPNAYCFTPSTFTAVQRVNDRFYYVDSNRVNESLRVHDTKSQSCSLLVKHVRSCTGFAVFPSFFNGGKVLFISSSNSLCQLDLLSKKVKVLALDFPHPSARLFSGPGTLAALLVPAARKDPAGSSLYSCSAKGKLQLLRSGLTVAHDMLAVNKAGDVLYFQPHPDKKELLRLVWLRLCKGWDGRGAYLVGSRDGSGFARLVDLDTISSSVALDSEGYLWVAQGRAIAQLTATGEATGKNFFIPADNYGSVGCMSGLQLIKDRMFTFTSTYNSALVVYDTESQSCSQLARGVSPNHGLAVITNNEGIRDKVLFVSTSNSLCLLDLGSKEVKVLEAEFSHPSARLFSGPGPLAALLVPDPSQSPPTSTLYSCSEEGELQLLRSGLNVAHKMLAVNKAGDVLLFQPHPDNKELSRLICLHCQQVLGKAIRTPANTPQWTRMVRITSFHHFHHQLGGFAALLLCSIRNGCDTYVVSIDRFSRRLLRAACVDRSPVLEAQGTLHTPMEDVVGFAADGAGFAALSLCKKRDSRDTYLVGSLDGSAFVKLVDFKAASRGIALDSEGCLWVAQDKIITQWTATGAATGKQFVVPDYHSASEGYVSALQLMKDRMLVFTTTWTNTLYMYNTESKSCSQLAQHVSSEHGLAVISSNEGKRDIVLFISGSNSLCQLDLNSKEVKVLIADFPHPSARLFSGPGPLAALLVPDLSQSPPTSCLYSYSEKGELQLLKSGLVVTGSMLAVNKAGDVLFFQPHPDKKELSRLFCLRFAVLSQLTATAQSIAADSEGHIWIAQDSVVTRLTASGASTGTSFCVRPARTGKTPPYAAVLAMQCVNNVWVIACRLYFITSSTAGHGGQSVLKTYDISSGNCSTLTKHVSSKNGFAVLCGGDTSHNDKVLFISGSNSLCQLDLGSKEVRVLTISFPHPSARFFSGPGPLAAMLVPDYRKSQTRRCLYTCSEAGALKLLLPGVVMAHDVLAVNKAGDALFFRPHLQKPKLLSLMCIRSAVPLSTGPSDVMSSCSSEVLTQPNVGGLEQCSARRNAVREARLASVPAALFALLLVTAWLAATPSHDGPAAATFLGRVLRNVALPAQLFLLPLLLALPTASHPLAPPLPPPSIMQLSHSGPSMQLQASDLGQQLCSAAAACVAWVCGRLTGSAGVPSLLPEAWAPGLLAAGWLGVGLLLAIAGGVVGWAASRALLATWELWLLATDRAAATAATASPLAPQPGPPRPASKVHHQPLPSHSPSTDWPQAQLHPALGGSSSSSSSRGLRPGQRGQGQGQQHKAKPGQGISKDVAGAVAAAMGVPAAAYALLPQPASLPQEVVPLLTLTTATALPALMTNHLRAYLAPSPHAWHAPGHSFGQTLGHTMGGQAGGTWLPGLGEQTLAAAGLWCWLGMAAALWWLAVPWLASGRWRSQEGERQQPTASASALNLDSAMHRGIHEGVSLDDLPDNGLHSSAFAAGPQMLAQTMARKAGAPSKVAAGRDGAAESSGTREGRVWMAVGDGQEVLLSPADLARVLPFDTPVRGLMRVSRAAEGVGLQPRATARQRELPGLCLRVVLGLLLPASSLPAEAGLPSGPPLPPSSSALHWVGGSGAEPWDGALLRRMAGQVGGLGDGKAVGAASQERQGSGLTPDSPDQQQPLGVGQGSVQGQWGQLQSQAAALTKQLVQGLSGLCALLSSVLWPGSRQEGALLATAVLAMAVTVAAGAVGVGLAASTQMKGGAALIAAGVVSDSLASQAAIPNVAEVVGSGASVAAQCTADGCRHSGVTYRSGEMGWAAADGGGGRDGRNNEDGGALDVADAGVEFGMQACVADN
ncbi:hypothetical protein QJQ45_012262 [Haematococcus lacustris]|nr:hypothetical protein QJQ45_012262 [Haematococcus lacustris]